MQMSNANYRTGVGTNICEGLVIAECDEDDGIGVGRYFCSEF